jgi:hypothetical protein
MVLSAATTTKYTNYELLIEKRKFKQTIEERIYHNKCILTPFSKE